jgi:hypothetical protein
MGRAMEILHRSPGKGDKERIESTTQDIGAGTAILEFETTMEGKYVNGVDIIRCNDEGRIIEFRVMIRPLQAVNLVHQQGEAMLEIDGTAGLMFFYYFRPELSGADRTALRHQAALGHYGAPHKTYGFIFIDTPAASGPVTWAIVCQIVSLSGNDEVRPTLWSSAALEAET